MKSMRLGIFFLSILKNVSSYILDIKLHEISYSNLIRLDESTGLLASNVLSTIGILKISDIPNLTVAQNEAFDSLSSCLIKNPYNNGVFETIMNDNIRRLTIGSKSVNGEIGVMTHECGKSSTSLRSIVDMISKQLFVSLDRALSISKIHVKKKDTLIKKDIHTAFSTSSVNTPLSQYLMKPYATFESLMNHGEHLEHMHAFYNTKQKFPNISYSKETDNFDVLPPLTMEMHTDAGLVIAMTTGYYKSNDDNSTMSNEHRGLFITLPSGEIAHVDENDLNANDIIIMTGQGASDWLNPNSGLTFRAVRHALVVDLGDNKQATRNWYGKMFLPPLDAEVFHSTLASGVTATFEQFREKELLASKLTTQEKSMTNMDDSKIVTRNANKLIIVPTACGKTLHAKTDSVHAVENLLFSRVRTPESCEVPSNGDPGIMCWARCVSTADMHCPKGQQPTCMDTADSHEVDGNIMCPSSKGMKACQVECHSMIEPSSAPLTPVPDNTHSDDALPDSPSHSPPVQQGFCTGSGTSMSMSGFISSATKLGLASECFIYLFPPWVLDTKVKFLLACFGTLLLGIAIHALSKLKMNLTQYRNISIKWKFWLNILLYFVQIILSYVVMLVAMTYNVELFLMVCIGLTLGYGLYHPQNYYSFSMSTSPFTTTNNNSGNDGKSDIMYQTVNNDNDKTYNSSKSLQNPLLNSESHIEPCCQDLDYESANLVASSGNKSSSNSKSKSNPNASESYIDANSSSSLLQYDSSMIGKRRGLK